MRDAGGLVVWIQTTATGGLERWGNHHRYTLSAEGARIRLASLDEDAEGFKLYAGLEPAPADPRVKKDHLQRFHAGIVRSCFLLRRLGIGTVLIAGTVTNVCCESSARHAMMLDYRVIMVSDADAALTDEEHAATLNSFFVAFGDVMTTDDAVQRLKRAVAGLRREPQPSDL